MRREQYEEDLMRRVISGILDHGGSDMLSSIILTGSFGREEPTYTVNEDGSFQLKSDVEIALVLSRNQYKKAVMQMIEEVSQAFTEELNLMPISAARIRKAQNFNYSLLPSRYKTVFTYDLFNGSKTIWGKDFLQENRVSLADVDPYEAKRLVANRIGELCCGCGAASDEAVSSFRRQWKRKVMLALGGAWLILNQEYVSSYRGQFDKIMSHKKAVNQALGEHFAEEYEKVFPLFQANARIYEVPDEMLKGFVQKMDQIFRTAGISRPKVNSVSRFAKYCAKYAKTGMRYGLVNFEDRILQKLITGFYEGHSDMDDTARVWRKVLY